MVEYMEEVNVISANQGILRALSPRLGITKISMFTASHVAELCREVTPEAYRLRLGH
jgi:hypothetical protein